MTPKSAGNKIKICKWTTSKLKTQVHQRTQYTELKKRQMREREGIFEIVHKGLGFPGDSEGRNLAANARDSRSTFGLGRSPGEGNGNSLQLFLPGD